MQIKGRHYFLTFLLGFFTLELNASPEMFIGKSSMEPGIDLIFEGGIKDDIQPTKFYLDENQTDVHLEVLANWSDNAPSGSPTSGHVAYLDVQAVVTNEQTNESSSVH